MKYVKVTIESVLAVPDEAEVATHPEDDVACLKVRNLWFSPAYEWARREPDGEWTAAGEEFEQLIEPRSENTTLQALSEDEFRNGFLGGNGAGPH